jgi:hypothetical protein
MNFTAFIMFRHSCWADNIVGGCQVSDVIFDILQIVDQWFWNLNINEQYCIGCNMKCKVDILEIVSERDTVQFNMIIVKYVILKCTMMIWNTSQYTAIQCNTATVQYCREQYNTVQYSQIQEVHKTVKYSRNAVNYPTNKDEEYKHYMFWMFDNFERFLTPTHTNTNTT